MFDGLVDVETVVVVVEVEVDVEVSARAAFGITKAPPKTNKQTANKNLFISF
jgi:hypothetical protein